MPLPGLLEGLPETFTVNRLDLTRPSLDGDPVPGSGEILPPDPGRERSLGARDGAGEKLPTR